MGGVLRWIAGALNVVLPIVISVYSALLPDVGTSCAGRWCESLATERVTYLAAFGAMNAVVGLVAVLGWGRSRARLRMLVAEYLHQRVFPTLAGNSKDKNYRVSFFVPRRPWFLLFTKVWLRCEHRTDGTGARRKWWNPEGELGLVVEAYKANARVECRGLSDAAKKTLAACNPHRTTVGLRGQIARGVWRLSHWWLGKKDQSVAGITGTVDQEIRKYLEESNSCVYVESARRWLGAAMLGVPVHLGSKLECGAVLLVECKIDGASIAYGRELEADVLLCSTALEESA